MADTSLVLNFPLVSSSGVIRPSNKRPSLAILTRISRTSSPMYMPLTIFSNLQQKSTRDLSVPPTYSPLRQLMSGGRDVRGEEGVASILTSAQSHWQARPCICVSKQRTDSGGTGVIQTPYPFPGLETGGEHQGAGAVREGCLEVEGTSGFRWRLMRRDLDMKVGYDHLVQKFMPYFLFLLFWGHAPWLKDS